MANWIGVITNSGAACFKEWINEAVLTIDHAASGTETVPEVSLLAQTALAGQEYHASIVGSQRVEEGIKLTIQTTPDETAHTLHQFGVWVKLNDGTPVLAALYQHQVGVHIPSRADSPDFVYTFYALISAVNVGSYQVTIDPAALVTVETMEAAINSAVAEIQGTAEQALTVAQAAQEAAQTAQQIANDAQEQAQSAQEAAQAAQNSASGITDLLGKPGGVPTLDETGTVPEEQLPSFANSTLSNLDTAQAALNNLGAGVRPRLGINMDFKINQHGQDSYTASGETYTVDGWYLTTTGGTLTVNSDGTITLGATNSTFWQLIPPDEFVLGEPFTFSVLTSLGKLYSVTVNELSENTDKIEQTDFGYIRIQYYNGNIGVNINPSQIITLSCAKPEQGPDQTLAYQDADGNLKRLPQPDMDYGTQLLKCQRYLSEWKYGEGSFSNAVVVASGFALNATIARFTLITPVPIRSDIKPTLTLSGMKVLKAPNTRFDISSSGVLWNPFGNAIGIECICNDATFSAGEQLYLESYKESVLSLSSQL